MHQVRRLPSAPPRARAAPKASSSPLVSHPLPMAESPPAASGPAGIRPAHLGYGRSHRARERHHALATLSRPLPAGHALQRPRITVSPQRPGPLDLLSAKAGVSPGQEAVYDKSNETVAIPLLLERLGTIMLLSIRARICNAPSRRARRPELPS